MIINFVGNFQTGYVGEQADEVHLAREMEVLGHTVRKIPRDEWREHVIENKPYPNVPTDLRADINIVAKWHHFYNGQFIAELREKSEAPVFYWVWDFMWDQGIPQWHLDMIMASDLYLGNDVRSGKYPSELKNKLYYFNFDVCDGNLVRKPFNEAPKTNDVVFTGTYMGLGHRIEWLKFINGYHPVTIYSWNHEEWLKNGFTNAFPAVYGEDFNRIIAQSKIVLGFSVEPNCWGYWSNRVGKVIRAGGFLLQEYAPGMEQFIEDKVEYFNSPTEAVQKIEYFLEHSQDRNKVVWKAIEDDEKFTSKRKIKQLMILVERYKKGDPNQWMI